MRLNILLSSISGILVVVPYNSTATCSNSLAVIASPHAMGTLIKLDFEHVPSLKIVS